ncbi:MAG: YkgJ family cysteine cluster protein [Promethearchaeota archaeon]|nr:MAG: YkgJ family cysteine cluster protein [Candidatus Lokiarchaeota archaeon]
MKLYKFECKKCAKCCKEKKLVVTITHRDVLRIYYGLKLETVDELLKYVAFFGVDINNQELLERLMYPSFILNDSYYVLGLNKENNTVCSFLENNICSIYKFRPKICRIFPFTFKEKNNRLTIQINELANKICPGLNNNAPLVIIKELKELWKQIITEKKEYEKLISLWNKLVSNKLLDSTPKTFLNFILGNIGIQSKIT